jgi:putative FmdB family regulatory protein
MPFYEYFCQACGYQFEKFNRIAERDLASCPKCGARADRKISVVNHTFGWTLADSSHERGNPDIRIRDV